MATVKRRKKNPHNPPMPDEVVQRAIRLRKMGWTYPDIAEELGFNSGQHAHHCVRQFMIQPALRAQETAEEHLQLELDRLEFLWKKLGESMEADEAADPKKVMAAVRIQERKAKLLGLDKPSEVEVNFSMTRLEEGNSSDRRLAVLLLQKCAVLLGEDPMEIAQEAVAMLEESRPKPALPAAVPDAEFVQNE
jgi:hypothetical protein